MKINKIYISAFGGLKDYTLELSDGFNVIYGDNENGKSTVMAFIKMMFYGSGRGSSDIAKNLRKKYAPWSGERAAGRIYFEHGGLNYCLEREFLRSDSTDKVRLINSDTGEIKAVSPTVGSEFFGLSAAAFDRTVFIGQTGAIAPDDEANGEINSKLSNIALTGDEDTSFQTVFGRLSDAKLKLMSKSGKAGIYDKGKAELEGLKAELQQAKERESRKKALNERLESIKAEVLQLSEKYTEVKKTADSETDIRNRAKLTEYLSLKDELDRLNAENRLTNGAFADESYVRKIEFCISKFDSAAERVIERNREIDRLRKSIELSENTSADELDKKQSELENQLSSKKAELEKIQNKIADAESNLTVKSEEKAALMGKKKPFSPALLIAGVLLAVLGAVLLIPKAAIPAAITLTAGAVLLILSFIIRPADIKAAENIDRAMLGIQAEISQLKATETEQSRKILTVTEELNAFLAAANADKAVLAARHAELDSHTAHLADEAEKKTAAEKELIDLYSLYKPTDTADSVKTGLTSLKAAAEGQKQIKLKLKYMSDDLGGISYEAAREKLAAMPQSTAASDTDFAAKRRELEELNGQLMQLKADYSAVQTELKTGFKNTAGAAEIIKKIENLENQLSKQRYFCDATELAANVLETSFIEVRRSYGSQLEKKALEIFKRLTGGKYANVNISKSLDITVEETNAFGTREVDYLSSGTVDQAYLSLRLALSKLISDNDTLPLFLDDVLTQYDDTRAERAIEFLKKYCKDGQAVMFTCHKSLCETADRYGIKCERLN